jgi:hypothetical protein
MQIRVRIVTDGASEVGILGVVTATIVQAIWLEPNVVDAAKIWHDRNSVNTPMACATVLLG